MLKRGEVDIAYLLDGTTRRVDQGRRADQAGLLRRDRHPPSRLFRHVGPEIALGRPARSQGGELGIQSEAGDLKAGTALGLNWMAEGPPQSAGLAHSASRAGGAHQPSLGPHHRGSVGVEFYTQCFEPITKFVVDSLLEGNRIRTLGGGSSRPKLSHSAISSVVFGDKTGDNTPLS
jgi:hypothetical protein